MKKFILTLLVFTIPLIASSIILDRMMTSALKTSRLGNFAVWNDLFSGKAGSDIIILGGSRAWVDINPRIIEKTLNQTAYNLAVNGHNFFMQYCRFATLLKYNKKPKIIILSLDTCTLYKRKDLFDWQYFLAYTDEPVIINTLKTYKGFNWYDYHLPLLRYSGAREAFGHLCKIWLNPACNTDTNYKGYQPMPLEWGQGLDKDPQIVRNRKQKSIMYFDIGSFKLFDKFLQETQAQGIKVIFIYAPEYIEGQPLLMNRDEVFTMFNYFARKYSIAFYDYSNDRMSYSKKYFYETDHLNSKGSDLFTKKLMGDIFQAGGKDDPAGTLEVN
jgi:hypothetical protein